MTDVRQDALKIAQKAIEAVLPENAVEAALRGEAFSARARSGGRIVLTAIGKAAWRMAKAAADTLGDGWTESRRDEVRAQQRPIKGIEIFEAGHPFRT
jgi:hydroxypyruvate reductase